MLELQYPTTPPGPTEEELIVQEREEEIKFSHELQADGCPPCYPVEFDLRLGDVPNTYCEIIQYWRWHDSFMPNTVLAKQHFHWTKFRKQQRMQRERCIKFKSYLGKYTDFIRKNREDHGLQGEVHLRISLEESDRQVEDWIEFQGWHIAYRTMKYEEELAKWHEGQARIQILQETGSFNEFGLYTPYPDPEKAEKVRRPIRPPPEWMYKQIELEKYFLRWTEEQRIAIESKFNATAETSKMRSSKRGHKEDDDTQSKRLKQDDDDDGHESTAVYQTSHQSSDHLASEQIDKADSSTLKPTLPQMAHEHDVPRVPPLITVKSKRPAKGGGRSGIKNENHGIESATLRRSPRTKRPTKRFS